MQPILNYLQHPSRFFIGLVKKTHQLYSDSLYLRLFFYFETGHVLHLNKPKSFGEKIQWLKINNRRPKYALMVDKYSVKDYVANIIGEKYVVPTLGVWDSVDQIDFESLPNRFVLKTTHGGGSDGIVFCANKELFDIEAAKNKLRLALKCDIYKTYKEWPYKDVPKRIIAEKYLSNIETVDENQSLIDYKFYIFNGMVKYCQVIANRKTNETIDFYDCEWNHLPFVGLLPYQKEIIINNAKDTQDEPDGYRLMIKLAEKLSKSIDAPFVRIDFYNIKGSPYFGEITFFPASGFGYFYPLDWNYKLGEMINLEKPKK